MAILIIGNKLIFNYDFIWVGMIIRPAGVRSAGSGFCKFFSDQGAAIPVRGSRSGYFAPHVFSVYRSPYTLILADNGYFT